MFIRSERLFLRPGWPEDWTELLGVIGDEAFALKLASGASPYIMADVIAAARQSQGWLLPHFFVTLPTGEGAKLIGSIWLDQVEDEVELSYWIAREHCGQGYATEAVRAVLGLAAMLGHRRICASHFAGDPASRRVLEKAGFRPTREREMRVGLEQSADVSPVTYGLEITGSGNLEDNQLMRAA